MVVYVKENIPSFFKLQSMLFAKENHSSASTSRDTDNKILYKETEWSRGHDG